MKLKVSSKLGSLIEIMQKFLARKNGSVKQVVVKNEGNLRRPIDGVSEELNKRKSISFDETEKRNILEELALVQNQLERAHVVFNFQTNLDLIESSIYYIEALESKYSYLLKKAKEMRLNCVLK